MPHPTRSLDDGRSDDVGHRDARRELLRWLACSGCGLATGTALSFDDAPARRWQGSLREFADADRRTPPAGDGVLFVGSSSIRLWDDLETSFGAGVLRRGFGGALLADCAALVPQLVWPHRPRLVVLYAGENDLAVGHTPAEVADSFRRFVAAVRQQLPRTRVAFVSIKPSPRRAALMAQMRQANALVRRVTQADEGLHFVDLHDAMLDEQGRPRAELYAPDRLHLSSEGYALWQREISSRLSW